MEQAAASVVEEGYEYGVGSLWGSDCVEIHDLMKMMVSAEPHSHELS